MLNLNFYFKIPAVALYGQILSDADITVLCHLCKMHFQFVHGDYDKEFYVTDRKLSFLSGKSTRTIRKAKKNLVDIGAIEFRIFDNKTYYKILLQNEDQ